MKKSIDYATYLDRILGGWIGKSIGGIIGAPYECHKQFNKAEREKYGTKENYAKSEVERIINSKAFEKFNEAGGGVKYSTEIKTEYGIDYLYLRFHY